MKKILAVVAVLAIAAVAAYFTLQNPLGKLVKLAIDEFGPEMTQAAVQVDGVEISATDGRGALSGLFLGNPRGFKSDYALRAGIVELKLDPASLASDVAVIHKILIDAPQIGYEKAGNITNFDAIQRNVEAYIGARGGKSEKQKQGSDKKMIIGSLVIRNARVNYNGMFELTLPDIELRNIGKKAGGATSIQVVKAIIMELNAKLVVALSKKMGVIGGAGNAVVGAGAAIKGLFDK
ncbi:MAG: hypothetical protein A3F73_08745 [Gallionellales bacterium RIFCSPLOWO2_12_FULL_59_22]|nr:MAG: hypothetical protein A3H99_09740 [Gallionellales bacterium RIFCSPLOWO2_02_FULL_59_110]OGT05297.1 MAG: hypothetical protein A2Z65_13520 [Gallionellales bacterium RIFCSPLOWO2_02_58_13]OGT12894.1 MAG: hypothetical protein A3F73_08745 [Gallionellales bacterium RIFCSPLOWO2_12_FULL_59_22]